MKITKERLLQIVNEEIVAFSAKKLNEATRSTVAIEDKNGKVRGTYIHSDGYLDGVLMSSEGSNTPNVARTLDLWIGSHGGDNTGTTDFDGKIRDVRIYEGTMTADQVASLYSGSYNVTPKYWWKMDDGSGTAVEDYG